MLNLLWTNPFIMSTIDASGDKLIPHNATFKIRWPLKIWEWMQRLCMDVTWSDGAYTQMCKQLQVMLSRWNNTHAILTPAAVSSLTPEPLWDHNHDVMQIYFCDIHYMYNNFIETPAHPFWDCCWCREVENAHKLYNYAFSKYTLWFHVIKTSPSKCEWKINK